MAQLVKAQVCHDACTSPCPLHSGSWEGGRESLATVGDSVRTCCINSVWHVQDAHAVQWTYCDHSVMCAGMLGATSGGCKGQDTAEMADWVMSHAALLMWITVSPYVMLSRRSFTQPWSAGSSNTK
jgi:hypothetical protein